MSERRGREIPVKRIELQSVRTLLGSDLPYGGAPTGGGGGEGAGGDQASELEPATQPRRRVPIFLSRPWTPGDSAAPPLSRSRLSHPPLCPCPILLKETVDEADP